MNFDVHILAKGPCLLLVAFNISRILNQIKHTKAFSRFLTFFSCGPKALLFSPFSAAFSTISEHTFAVQSKFHGRTNVQYFFDILEQSIPQVQQTMKERSRLQLKRDGTR
jgi:hypothetical protein